MANTSTTLTVYLVAQTASTPVRWHILPSVIQARTYASTNSPSIRPITSIGTPARPAHQVSHVARWPLWMQLTVLEHLQQRQRRNVHSFGCVRERRVHSTLGTATLQVGQHLLKLGVHRVGKVGLGRSLTQYSAKLRPQDVQKCTREGQGRSQLTKTTTRSEQGSVRTNAAAVGASNTSTTSGDDG